MFTQTEKTDRGRQANKKRRTARQTDRQTHRNTQTDRGRTKFTSGMRHNKALALSVLTAKPTRYVRMSLYTLLSMQGMTKTPSSEPKLMSVTQRIQ